jgi:hypothetical protein
MSDKMIPIEDLGNAKLETRQYSPNGMQPDSVYGTGALYG